MWCAQMNLGFPEDATVLVTVATEAVVRVGPSVEAGMVVLAVVGDTIVTAVVPLLVAVATVPTTDQIDIRHAPLPSAKSERVTHPQCVVAASPAHEVEHSDSDAFVPRPFCGAFPQ